MSCTERVRRPCRRRHLGRHSGGRLQPKGMVLANVGGITIDMNVWLPLLIALPLIFLGYTAATAKSGPNSAPVMGAKAASPAKKATPKRLRREEGHAEKEVHTEEEGPFRSKTPKGQLGEKSASRRRKVASKGATSKTPVRSKSTRRRKALSSTTHHFPLVRHSCRHSGALPSKMLPRSSVAAGFQQY